MTYEEFLEDVLHNKDMLMCMLERDDRDGIMNHAEDVGIDFDDRTDYVDLVAKALLVVMFK